MWRFRLFRVSFVMVAFFVTEPVWAGKLWTFDVAAVPAVVLPLSKRHPFPTNRLPSQPILR